MENNCSLNIQNLVQKNTIKREIDEEEYVCVDVNQMLEVHLLNEKENKEKMAENDEYLVSSLFRIEAERNASNSQDCPLNNWVIENGNYVNKLNQNSVTKAHSATKTLFEESALKKHNLNDILDKPHGCDICGKYFTRKDHLRRHEQAHTGMTPFTCEECGKSFNRKDRLTRHKLIHSRQFSYECDMCTKIFVRKDHLTTHRKTHIQEKSYLCSYCNKTFSRKDHLTEHKKSHHS